MFILSKSRCKNESRWGLKNLGAMTKEMCDIRSVSLDEESEFIVGINNITVVYTSLSSL